VDGPQNVAVVNDDGAVNRFGFAYGTLPDHAGSGEERFLVEWDTDDDSVWYDILAFSRPRHFLARLGYPWMRRAQKPFGRQSAAAMRRAVRESCRFQKPYDNVHRRRRASYRVRLIYTAPTQRDISAGG